MRSLIKRARPETKVRTWCNICSKPLDWWTMSYEGAISLRGGTTPPFLPDASSLPIGKRVAVATPVLSMGCHGDVVTIGCSSDPDVLAGWFTEFRPPYRDGEKVLSIGSAGDA